MIKTSVRIIIKLKYLCFGVVRVPRMEGCGIEIWRNEIDHETPEPLFYFSALLLCKY